jgi:hypothetical protein
MGRVRLVEVQPHDREEAREHAVAEGMDPSRGHSEFVTMPAESLEGYVSLALTGDVPTLATWRVDGEARAVKTRSGLLQWPLGRPPER